MLQNIKIEKKDNSEGFLRNPLSLPTASLQITERCACLSKLRQTIRPFYLRKVGDSNPRYACAYTAFRVRLFRPLRQLSFNSTAKVVLFSYIRK